jgi:hypothetical protein
MADEASGRPGSVGVQTMEDAPTYRPLSLLAVLGLVLSVFFSLTVLVGGLIPFMRAYTTSFVVLILLAPIVAALAAVLARQRNPNRIAAIAGLGLVGVVVLMGLGGLVGFSGHAPWILEGWAWLLLLVALLVCMIALSKISSSEGTLAGRDLARTGLYLSLFFGGYYLLYLAANTFAVTGQAQAAADRYLDLLRQDQLELAFVETLKPGTRPTGADLKRELQAVHNVAGPDGIGAYTGYALSELVQIIRADPKTTFRRTSVSSQHEENAYHADVTYQMSNTLGTFEINVRTQSVETGAPTRQWYILGPGCKVRNRITPSDEYKKITGAIDMTRGLATQWVNDLQQSQTDSAYLLTLPRLPREQRLPRALALSLQWPTVNVAAPFVDFEELEKEKKAFTEGKLMDSSSLPNDSLRAEIIRAMTGYFNPNLKVSMRGEVHAMIEWPNSRVLPDGTVEVSWPASFSQLDPVKQVAVLQMRGEVVCRGTMEKGFHVAALRLTEGTDKITQGPGPPRGR